MTDLNKISKTDILQILSDQTKRIARLEAMLQGQPIGTVRIADAAITDAKITSLSADKITAGTIVVQVGLGESDTGSIVIDGVNVRIVMYSLTYDQLLIGEDGT